MHAPEWFALNESLQTFNTESKFPQSQRTFGA
jgi:hypothetical protein